MAYDQTVDHVDLSRFMGKWYVLAGRMTFLETQAHNAMESYTWNEEKQQIDIDFSMNKGSFEGSRRSVPQTGWVINKTTNAHWVVSPFWPLKFDYLVIDLADDYSWTAIGVPSERYLWIMSKTWKNQDAVVEEVLKRVKEKGYRIDDVVRVTQQW